MKTFREMSRNEIADAAMARMSEITADCLGPEALKDRYEADVAEERERLRALPPTLNEALDLLARNKVLVEILTRERARAVNFSEALADLCAQIIQNLSAGQRAGGAALRAVNKGPNGRTYAELKIEVQSAWASGIYPSRNACADAEHQRLGLTLKKAREYLIGTADPVRTAIPPG